MAKSRDGLMWINRTPSGSWTVSGRSNEFTAYGTKGRANRQLPRSTFPPRRSRSGSTATVTGRVFDPLTLSSVPGGSGGYCQLRVTVQAASPRAITLTESVIKAHETFGFMGVLLWHEGCRSGMEGRLLGEDERFMKEA